MQCCQIGEIAMMMARKRSKNLSDRHKKIIQVLKDFQEKVGYPPSIREIGAQAKISSTSVVNYYLDQLEEMGYIKRDNRVSRGICLLEPAMQLSNPLSSAARAVSNVRQTSEVMRERMGEMFRIPMVGRIVAGAPMPVPQSDFAYYDTESAVDVASSLLPSRERSNDLFALEVQGDSMIDALVYDGDIVIMKPAQDARNGEMVAVWLNDRDETTLKYFYREKDGRVRLQPANQTMQPIYIDNPTNVQVQGKVVMVIRQLKGLAA
jgi:repressor LexA